MGNLWHVKWSPCGVKTHFCNGHWQDSQLRFRQSVSKVVLNVAMGVEFHSLLHSSASLPGSPSPLFITENSCPVPEVCLGLGKGLSLKEFILHKTEENGVPTHSTATVNSKGRHKPRLNDFGKLMGKRKKRLGRFALTIRRQSSVVGTEPVCTRSSVQSLWQKKTHSSLGAEVAATVPPGMAFHHSNRKGTNTVYQTFNHKNHYGKKYVYHST